ncbi:MAG: hypothetical protein KDA21_02815, partial [Phycisphaerales bacterium]|nr:hypothetical protein [Phycisphaerales bacterium]
IENSAEAVVGGSITIRNTPGSLIAISASDLTASQIDLYGGSIESSSGARLSITGSGDSAFIAGTSDFTTDSEGMLAGTLGIGVLGVHTTTIDDASLRANGSIILGRSGGHGIVNITNTGELIADQVVVLTEVPGSTATLALTNGTVAADDLVFGTGTISFAFAGGTLQLDADQVLGSTRIAELNGGMDLPSGALNVSAGRTFAFLGEARLTEDRDVAIDGGTFRAGTIVQPSAAHEILWSSGTFELIDEAMAIGLSGPLQENLTVIDAGRTLIARQQLTVKTAATLEQTGGGVIITDDILVLEAGAAFRSDGGAVQGAISTTPGSELEVNGHLTVGNGMGNGFVSSGRITIDAAAILTIDDSDQAQLGLASELIMRIGGLTPGVEHSQIIAPNGVNTDGILTVELTNGFIPEVGDSFQLIDAPAISGAFDTLNLDAPPSDRAWIYDSGTLTCIRQPCSDANGDGMVNFDDLNVVLQNWALSVTPGTNGDIDGSGLVDFDDLNLILQNWEDDCSST